MGTSTAWVPALWREIFDKLLDDDNELDYEDQWNLNFSYIQTDEVTKEEKKRGWRVYCYNCLGHFKCESCSNSWSSARVKVLFRYRLRGNRGIVIMRPFGQQCRDCQNNAFQRCGFATKEVEDALLRLLSKIRKYCYGEEEEDESPNKHTERHTKPHEKALCEACHNGICCQDD